MQRARPRRAPPARRSASPPARSCARTARRISARLRWIAGTRMCDDQSPASWSISSARSVSIAWMPSSASAVVEPDLVGRDRLDLDHLARAVRLARCRATIAFASAASRAQWTCRRPRCTDASSRSSCSGSVAIARALIAAPALRSSSQSASSRPTRRRLSRIVVVALPRLRRSWLSCSARAPPRGAGVHVRRQDLGQVQRAHAGALARAARRRCASGRSCRRRRRPRRRCRAPAQLVGQHRHRGVGVLDRERAAEAAALAARAARPGRSAHARSSRSGGSPTPQQPQRVARRVVGDAVREARADVLDAEHVDDELGQLEQPAATRRASARARAAGARGRRRDDRS